MSQIVILNNYILIQEVNYLYNFSIIRNVELSVQINDNSVIQILHH